MRIFIKSLFLVSFFCAGAFAQTAQNDWVRIEADNKEISVVMPSLYLVKADKPKQIPTSFWIIGQVDGLRTELSVYEEKDARQKIAASSSKGEPFSAFGLTGVRSCPPVSEKISCQIAFASDSRRYVLFLEADRKNAETAARVLAAVRVNDKPVFGGEADGMPSSRTIKLSGLTTSPEIAALFKSDRVSKDPDAVIKPLEDWKEDIPVGPGNRPPVILEKPHPSFRYMSTDDRGRTSVVTPKGMGGIASNPTQGGEFLLKLKVKFLASGKMGDVTVFWNNPKADISPYLMAVSRIRFVPALIDGKAADSTLTITYPLY